MRVRAGLALTVLLLLTYIPATGAEDTNENLVSTGNTTHSHEEYYGYFVAPDRAFNGNTSTNNYSRIITSCLYYVGSLTCEEGNFFIDAVYTISFQNDAEYVNVSTISKTGDLS